jgi:hypothetical protein
MPLTKDPEITLFSAKLPVEYQNRGGEKSVTIVSILESDFLKSFKKLKLIFSPKK